MAKLSGNAGKIRKALPPDGTMVGNISLMRRLGIKPKDFFSAKAELDEEGLIVFGKGKGGSIGIAKPSLGGATRKPQVEKEFELYDPLKGFFDEYWGPNYNTPDLYISKVTGPPKGHKRKSGVWSRPDVSILTISRYDFVPERVLEVTTVEAKRYPDIGPRAVFETASHSRFGHQAYLALEWPEKQNLDDSPDEDVQEVIKESRRFGIGIIQMRRVTGEWDISIILEPVRREPDPADCSGFIGQVFKENHKQIRHAIGR